MLAIIVPVAKGNGSVVTKDVNWVRIKFLTVSLGDDL